MLSCKDVTEKANSYLDDELTFMKRLRVRMHLFICKNCQRYVDQLHVTISTLGHMHEPESISKEESQKIVECFKKERHSHEKPDAG